MMIAATFSSVRQRFKDFCDRATKDYETIIITRERGDNVVMLSEAEYNNLMENLYVRSNRASYDELMRSIDQLKKGKGKTRELLDE
jgi:antitoxin YefM